MSFLIESGVPADSVVVADMLAQHAGIGEAGTDECGMNASAHEVLTSCPHHAQLGMLADDVTEGTRHGLFRQCRANIEHAGSGGHQRQ